MTVFQEMVVESILPNQIKWSWYHSFQKTMFYLMKSKYAIFSNIKVTKFKRSAFFGTPGIVLSRVNKIMGVQSDLLPKAMEYQEINITIYCLTLWRLNLKNFWTLIDVCVFRWTNEQPGIQKFWKSMRSLWRCLWLNITTE